MSTWNTQDVAADVGSSAQGGFPVAQASNAHATSSLPLRLTTHVPRHHPKLRYYRGTMLGHGWQLIFSRSGRTLGSACRMTAQLWWKRNQPSATRAAMTLFDLDDHSTQFYRAELRRKPVYLPAWKRECSSQDRTARKLGARSAPSRRFPPMVPLSAWPSSSWGEVSECTVSVSTACTAAHCTRKSPIEAQLGSIPTSFESPVTSLSLLRSSREISTALSSSIRMTVSYVIATDCTEEFLGAIRSAPSWSPSPLRETRSGYLVTPSSLI